jgi:hypothetical protein
VNTLNIHSKTQSEKTAPEISLPAQERSYHEIPGLGHETRDVLKQLDANIQLLEDLSGRLSFALNEIRGVIRR